MSKRKLVEQYHEETIRFSVQHEHDNRGMNYDIKVCRYYDEEVGVWFGWSIELVDNPWGKVISEDMLKDINKVFRKVKGLNRKV